MITTCKPNMLLHVWQSFIFLLKFILWWAAIELKALSKLVFICFYQSVFNLASALESQVYAPALELARLWFPAPRHTVTVMFFTENRVQRWWADSYKFSELRLRFWVGFVPNLIYIFHKLVLLPKRSSCFLCGFPCFFASSGQSFPVFNNIFSFSNTYT